MRLVARDFCRRVAPRQSLRSDALERACASAQAATRARGVQPPQVYARPGQVAIGRLPARVQRHRCSPIASFDDLPHGPTREASVTPQEHAAGAAAALDTRRLLSGAGLRSKE